MKLEVNKFNVDRVEDEPYKTTLDLIRDVTNQHTKEILAELGVLSSDVGYNSKRYELHYSIYHAVKATFNLS